MTTPRPSLGLWALTLLLTLGVLPGLFATNAVAATLEVTGPRGAMVSLNERLLGAFPLDGPLDLPPGSYTLRCQQQGHLPYDQTVRLIGARDWQRIAVRLVPYSRRTAWSSNLLLAGLGQHYLGHGLRGYVYNAAEAGGLLTALAGELQRSNLKSDYLRLVARYNSAINAEEIVSYRAAADNKYTEMQDMAKLRDQGLMIAAGAIVVSLVDALLSFPAIEAGTGPTPVDTAANGAADPQYSWSDSSSRATLHAGVRLSF